MDGTNGSDTAKPGLPLVRALDRGVRLLKAFSFAEPRLTLSDLARRTDLDKGTTRRLLNTLALAGLVEHDPRGGVYYLSAGVLQLAEAVETGRDFRAVAAPFLAELSEQSGATGFLWILHEDAALCIERVCARVSAVTPNWSNVGARVPLNIGGAPRVLLAHLPAEERARILAGPLEARTDRSETDPAVIEAAMDAIRERGWEMRSDDYYVGLTALGVPVYDARGTLVGAMSLTNLTQQIIDDTGAPRHLDLMRDTAATIGRALV